MELGLLPALGSGIGELRRTGQASRLIEGYLKPYARAFARVWYFSYLPEALADFTDDRELGDTVRLLGPGRLRSRLLRALGICRPIPMWSRSSPMTSAVPPSPFTFLNWLSVIVLD